MVKVSVESSFLHQVKLLNLKIITIFTFVHLKIVMYRDNFKHQLLDSFKRQTNCDVWFNLNNGNKTEKIGAHKMVLSLASDVFKTMFLNKQDPESENVINIKDVKKPTFSKFMR